MGEKTLKFNNIKANKKEFHKSKQAIDLDSVKKIKLRSIKKKNTLKKKLQNII